MRAWGCNPPGLLNSSGPNVSDFIGLTLQSSSKMSWQGGTGAHWMSLDVQLKCN